MEYTSTRDGARRVTAAQAILTGLAPDGGLFVPCAVPTVDFAALQGKTYAEMALAILRAWLPDYGEGPLRQAVDAAYGAPFSGKAGHLAKLDDGLYSLELWHGPTAAFKDYALQLMPKLFVQARDMRGETGETIILVATSGDTGSAALAGYGDVPGVRIAVFYPENGTSPLQRLQMTTQTAGNAAVYGVKGSFDDAQRGVKAAFVSEELAAALAKKGAKLSSANSINWGRLAPQIVYYATSYLALCAQRVLAYGEELDFCVPTGNFGDIMAGWYAKRMGLPIGKLFCASNRNNVLADFLNTGVYNAKREFFKTSSPSMDILVSSNLERLLWHEGGGEKVCAWMRDLAEKGEYTVDKETLGNVRRTFTAGWAGEEAVADEIGSIWSRYDYLCDPHTAVAFRVWRQHAEGTGRPAVVLSTASPYKFPRQVLKALGEKAPEEEFAALRRLEARTGVKAPHGLASLADKVERFTEIIEPAQIAGIPKNLL